MSKKTNVVEDVKPLQEKKENRVSLKAVEDLEKVSKVGFYAEMRDDQEPLLEPLVRLRCESKDGESEDTTLTPWCTAANLSAMIQGCLYMHPLIISTIKDRQANAPKPQE